MKKVISAILMLSLMLFSTSCSSSDIPSEDVQDTILTTVEAITSIEDTSAEGLEEVSAYETTVSDEDRIETEADETEAFTLDFDNEESFEKELNDGANLEGKTVRFVVGELHPDSTFGYNIWSGEHLNFVSDKNPDVKVGDVVTAKITSIRNVLGSWIIDYEKISVQACLDTEAVTENPVDEDSRKIKDGFEHSSNQVYPLASYSVEIPSYWMLSGNDEVQWLYAETGGCVAMIQLSVQYETDDSYPVTFDGLYSDNENMINSIESSTSATVTDYEIIDTGNVKGILYKCYSDDMGSGLSGNQEWFCFASESDRSWCTIILGQTDNTEFDYTEDFRKIINSIKPIPVTATETETETTVTTTVATTTVATTTTVSTTTKSNEQDYVLNTNTMKFHYPHCSSVKKIKDGNRSDYTGTREELIDMGYSPCGNCHP